MSSVDAKQRGEIGYWRGRKSAEGTLTNSHFLYFFTTHFGFEPSFYSDKKVLDVGCGPRGSLEWATMATERVGLDPLADAYRELGTESHGMRYVARPAESIPFSENYFDIVSSFNSLDHVDDIEQAIAEITRVVAKNGHFLLLTDIHEKPTVLEPQSVAWDIVDKFAPKLRLIDLRHYEKKGGMYQSIQGGTLFDHTNPAPRYGILSAKFIKA